MINGETLRKKKKKPTYWWKAGSGVGSLVVSLTWSASPAESSQSCISASQPSRQLSRAWSLSLCSCTSRLSSLAGLPGTDATPTPPTLRRFKLMLCCWGCLAEMKGRRLDRTSRYITTASFKPQTLFHTFAISAFSEYIPQSPGASGKGQRFAFWLPSFERAVHPWRAELGQRRQTLPVEAALWDASSPIRGGSLTSRRAGSLEDELDVAGVLTPLVERQHRVLMGSQVAFCLTPFLN